MLISPHGSHGLAHCVLHYDRLWLSTTGGDADARWCWPQLLIDKGRCFLFSFPLTTYLFSFYQSRSAAEIGPSVLDSVTLKRWMYGGSKESHLFPLTRSVKWIEGKPFDLAFTLPFFSPTAEFTLLSQLLQTEKVMGLRFCPDKGVRTLSLLLTPLSHQWDQGGKGRGHWDPVSQSLPPSSCLKTSATELPLASLYLIPTSSGGSMDSVVWRHIHHLLSYQMQARDCRGAHILGSGSRWKALEGCLSSQPALTASAGIESRFKKRSSD